MRNFIILIICGLVITSCSFFEGTGVDFEIQNNTDRTLNKVRIKTTDGSKTSIFKKVESGKSVSGFLKMDTDKNDGSYILEFKRENEEIEKYMNGYFSIGAAMSHKIIFEIEADTVKFSTEHYY
ncbi:hypothetical protein [Salegentibacter mishustinae]|uniref:hypothetical protein n=1 Tax=Salegentibacter mishustinae TaxID=270918 RepID=UPI0024929ECB|nr:hypothetical protein [Salegentibacter mishustinae]